MESPSTPVQQMPVYVSQKLVQALKIDSMTPITRNDGAIKSYLLHFSAGYGAVRVTADWAHKHDAQAGGYFIRYQDGYESWAPAYVFEAGNTPVEEWGLPRAQEPKYATGERGRIVNRASGKEIPSDEPIFILRAQDKLAMQTLQAYRSMSASAGLDPSSIDERILAFSHFANAHRERMKYPNLWPTEKPTSGADVAPVGACNPTVPAGVDQDIEFSKFRTWALDKGYDVASSFEMDRSRYVFFSAMTADLWACWLETCTAR